MGRRHPLSLVATIDRDFNNTLGMNIPLNLMALENITSVLLLAIFMAACIGWFVHLVLVTPPTEPAGPVPSLADDDDDDD